MRRINTKIEKMIDLKKLIKFGKRIAQMLNFQIFWLLINRNWFWQKQIWIQRCLI